LQWFSNIFRRFTSVSSVFFVCSSCCILDVFKNRSMLHIRYAWEAVDGANDI
jgi:hypothetical protein